MAKFWSTNPDLVEKWNYRDFLNRQEYMHVHIEMMPKPAAQREEVPWGGPDSVSNG